MKHILFNIFLLAAITFAGGKEVKFGGLQGKIPSGFEIDGSTRGENSGTFSFIELYEEEEHQEWNTSTSSWRTIAKEITIYDSTAKTVTIIEQELVEGQLQNDSKSVIYIDINMTDSTFKFNKMESYSWAGTDWSMNGRTIYQYDANGFLVTTTTEFQLAPGMFLAMMRTTFTNNAAGNPELELTENYNMGTTQWENNSKTELTYKAGNMNYLETETNYDWTDGAWVASYKSVYTRNAQLNPTEILYQDNFSGSFVNNGREVITYLADGESQDSSYYYYWDQIGSNWRPSSLFVYTYNASGDEDVIYYKSWNLTTWENDSKISMTYDAMGKEIVELTEVWESGTYRNDYRELTTYTVTSIKEDAAPVLFTLKNNYPNPFNPSTTIEYEVKSAGMVTLTVYNVLGQIVAVLQNGFQQAGVYKVEFDASGLTSGVYLYELASGNTKITKKMILNK